MRYSTNYDIGDRKRGQGINEDSVSLTVFEEGHRDGYRGQDRPQSKEPVTAGGDETADVTGETAGTETAADTADDTDAADTADADTSDTDGDGKPMNRSAGVFVVADGAGGHDAGDIASYITTTIVAEQLAPVAIRTARSYPGGFDVDVARDVLPDPPGERELETAVAEAITAAHREIIRYANETGTQSYTTVVAGIYADGKLHYGWVGDSRAYVVNSVRETISPLTRDHAVVQEWVDNDEIDPVEAHVHPNGNEITRALGGSGYEDPDEATVGVDTRTVRLYAEDTVLATSDGLIDAQTDAPELYEEYVDSDHADTVAERIREAAVTDDEIRDVVLDAASLDAASQEFVSLANNRGGKDNISVLLFADSALPKTPESGGMPVRDIDPDLDISERDTVIMTDE
ncbi:protein phosphatase [Haloarcula taiwanensis]|uniref:Protein phosphatase n=1 Tax=Haloarcula taiwanensis TaxID=1932004 RepID=A0A2H4ZYN7_9EURY|nr:MULTISPECIES: protein phosphatase 2C domain-containing protein [Haloarcula]AUG47550.1 protein phosphatase [Haloarcula taiwanensis]RLM33778.1 serine/threonine-protein phosphatase [Haloarcula sp. Atlit-120R]RLM42664.1 serine/threonine-protein phosphatase [Haloarcula sp. Atlit-47R]RLM95801.1 serine/threonine-protein phosphatase [Haloarcula sp. Atlit-7R]